MSKGRAGRIGRSGKGCFAVLVSLLLLGAYAAEAGDLYTDNLTVYAKLTVADVDEPTTDSWELYYPFDSDEGSSVTDQSGNDNTGTVVSATWTNAGYSGGGMYFDGSNAYINVGDNDAISNGTVALWVKLSSIGAEQYLVSKVKAGANDGEWRLYVESDGDVNFRIQSTSTNYSILSDSPLSSNQWCHIGVTWEKNGTMYMYVDGSLQQGTASPTVGMEVTGVDLNLGRNNVLASSYFGGTMDEVLMYTRALSDQEMYELYLVDNAPEGAGTTYIPAVGDLSMGVFTNSP